MSARDVQAADAGNATADLAGSDRATGTTGDRAFDEIRTGRARRTAGNRAGRSIAVHDSAWSAVRADTVGRVRDGGCRGHEDTCRDRRNSYQFQVSSVPESGVQLNRFATRGGSTFRTATNGTHGQPGTIARPFSLSMASTIVATPVSLSTISVVVADLAVISDSMYPGSRTVTLRRHGPFPPPARNWHR